MSLQNAQKGGKNNTHKAWRPMAGGLGVTLEFGTLQHKPEVFPWVECFRAVRSQGGAGFGGR